MIEKIIEISIYLFACLGVASFMGFILVVVLAYCTPAEVEKEPGTNEPDDDYNHIIF